MSKPTEKAEVDAEKQSLITADAAEKERQDAIKAKNKAELSKSMVTIGLLCTVLASYMICDSYMTVSADPCNDEYGIGCYEIEINGVKTFHYQKKGVSGNFDGKSGDQTEEHDVGFGNIVGPALLKAELFVVLGIYGVAITIAGLCGGASDSVALVMAFVGWFYGSTMYVTENKKAGYAIGRAIHGDHKMGKYSNMTLSLATMQLFVCTVYPLLLWLIRWNPIKLTGLQKAEPMKLPKLTFKDILSTIPLAFFSGSAHACGVYCTTFAPMMGQVVKSSEPVMSAIVNTFVYSKPPTVPKWFCIFFIVLGVAISCLKKKDGGLLFGIWDIETGMAVVLCLIFGVANSTMAAFKGGETKKLLETPGLKDRFGGLSNQFAVTEILAFTLSIPFVVVVEGLVCKSLYKFFGLLCGFMPVDEENPVAPSFTVDGFNSKGEATKVDVKIPVGGIDEAWFSEHIKNGEYVQYDTRKVDDVTGTTKVLDVSKINTYPSQEQAFLTQSAEFRRALILSGIFFYLYNELATMTIKACGAVFSSVMNTAKRVICLLVMCVVPIGGTYEKMTPEIKVGASIAIGFVMIYSIIDDVLVMIGCAKPAAAPAAADAKMPKVTNDEDTDEVTSDEEEAAEVKPLKGGAMV